MLRLSNIKQSGKDTHGPGALVRLYSGVEGIDDVYCLVMPDSLLPWSPLSYLKLLTVDTPDGRSEFVKPEWVRYIWVDSPRGTTFAHLTKTGLNWFLAAGASCCGVATAEEGMSATLIQCKSREGPLKLKYISATVERVNETLELSVKVKKVKKMEKNQKMERNGVLVEDDGNVLGVTCSGKHYPLITSEFLADFMWRIRC